MKNTALLAGLYRLNWIDPQYTLPDQESILTTLEDHGIDYFARGDYDKTALTQMLPEDRTRYVLSFFKDYLENLSLGLNWNYDDREMPGVAINCIL